ncbi:MAG: FkbM family methyltransferase, partial [Candidatus Omnitrophica bacterium]|nr:FkbM family methyltransferase [Candidatus Omnitrophota bacterium]
SVLSASEKPRMCLVSQPLAACDAEYVNFDFAPEHFFEGYRLFHHPFVVKHLPHFASSKVRDSYLDTISLLFKAKTGKLIVSQRESYDIAIRKAPLHLWMLKKDYRVFLKLLVMKLNAIKIYKKVAVIREKIRSCKPQGKTSIKHCSGSLLYRMHSQKKYSKHITLDANAEKEIMQIIKQYLPDDPVIIEAGAYGGMDTIEMSTLWPDGTIYAFEPVPELFQKLWDNTYQLKNVCRYPFALGDKTGTAVLYVSSGDSNALSSLLPPKECLTFCPNVFFRSQIEVNVIPLDVWAEKQNVGNVDLLWLEVQGYELKVLTGAMNMLKNVKAIYAGINLTETYQSVPLYNELRQWLEQKGFYVAEEMFSDGFRGNALFVNANFHKNRLRTETHMEKTLRTQR